MSLPYLPYAAHLVRELKRIAPPAEVDARLQQFVAEHYGDAKDALAEEGRTHRRHNINTNFDNIEISGRYDRTIRTAINVVLEQLFQVGLTRPEDAARFGPLLRVEDPTDRLITVKEKPSHIDWVTGSLSQEEFAKFADWDAIVERVRSPTDDWIPIFEDTEQRISDRISSSKAARASKVLASLFFAPTGERGLLTEELSEMQPGWINLYRFQLPSMRSAFDGASLLARKGALTQYSIRGFRGRPSNSIAALRPTLARILGLERNNNDYLGYRFGEKEVVRSTEWQEAFDQGRRRHEPVSSGFLLEIDRTFLREWAQMNDLTLWANLSVDRSVDQYQPESSMSWLNRSEVTEVRLDRS